MDRNHTEQAKNLHVKLVRPSEVPWRRLGQYLYRVLEDGSQTQMRLCIIESLIPPKSSGPIFHFHEMHDEGFIVTKGRIRFHSPGSPDVDAQAGDIITVPVRKPHKFSNPFDEEATFLNTITPGFFVRYFEHLEQLIGEGKELTPEVNMAALRRFATIPLSAEDVEKLDRDVGELEEQIRGEGGKLNGKKLNGLGSNGQKMEAEKVSDEKVDGRVIDLEVNDEAQAPNGVTAS